MSGARAIRDAFHAVEGGEAVVEAVPVAKCALVVLVDVDLPVDEVGGREGHRLLVEMAEDRVALQRIRTADDRARRIASRVDRRGAEDAVERNDVALVVDIEPAERAVLIAGCGLSGARAALEPR